MPLEAFNASASIIDVLNGGVNSVGRSVLLGQQNIQTNAVRSIEESFASRIDEAISRLDQTDTSPKISALRREQSILVSRKERLNEAIEVLNKTLTQTKLIKNAINHLSDRLDDLEAGTITPASMTTDWDNTLRKINILVEGATVTFKDRGVSRELNLIKSDGSRTSFPKNRSFTSGAVGILSTELPKSSIPFRNRSFLAPFNSNGDTLLINGTFLGTDFFLQEVDDPFLEAGVFAGLSKGSRSSVWNSNTAFLDTEEETGTLTEFTSLADFSPTGTSGSVVGPPSGNTAFVDFVKENTNHDGKDVIAWADNNFDPVISIHLATVERGGLGLLDAWVYNNFNTTQIQGVDVAKIRQFAKEDLGVRFIANALGDRDVVNTGAMSKVVFAEKEFKHALDTLQSRANLFDPFIAGIETEISNIIETSLSEKEAIVSSLKLASQVAQFDLAVLASRGDTLVSSLLLSQDNFNNGLGSSFKATGDALLGATLSIQA